jgi:hypothetical protein
VTTPESALAGALDCRICYDPSHRADHHLHGGEDAHYEGAYCRPDRATPDALREAQGRADARLALAAGRLVARWRSDPTADDLMEELASALEDVGAAASDIIARALDTTEPSTEPLTPEEEAR